MKQQSFYLAERHINEQNKTIQTLLSVDQQYMANNQFARMVIANRRRVVRSRERITWTLIHL